EYRAGSGRAAVEGGAEEIAAAVLQQAGVGVAPVGIVEGDQRGDGAAAGGHLEDRADSQRAAIGGSAEGIAAAVQHQASVGVGPVGIVEGGQRGDGAAAGGHLEYRAASKVAAKGGGAEEIAAAVQYQTGIGEAPVDPV